MLRTGPANCRCGALQRLRRNRRVTRCCWRLPLLAASSYLVLGLGIAPDHARAQDVQEFRPALGDAGFLGVDGTRTPGMLRGSANLFADLAFDPVRFGSTSLVDRRFVLHLGLELGLWGRGAVALRVPLIPYQHSDVSGLSSVFAVSDPQLLVRYRFVGASMADRDEPHDGPGMALQLGAAFPLGKGPIDSTRATPLGAASYPFASDGVVRSDVALVGDFQLLGAGVSGTLGYRHHFWRRASPEATALGVNDQLTFGAALKVPIPQLPVLAGVLEIRGASGFQKLRDTPLELGIAARLTLGDFVIVLGGGVGLTHALGTPAGRLLLGVYGVLPEGDKDHDGVDDTDDACAFLAEDLDGFQDADGCPDPDNDNDLIPDLDDKCPSVAAEEDRDVDEDGCTDPAPAAEAAPAPAQPAAAEAAQ